MSNNASVICYVILFTSTKPCKNWVQYEDSILGHENISVCTLIPKFWGKGKRVKTSKMNSWTLPLKSWDVVTHWCGSEPQKILTLKYTATKTTNFAELNIFLTCLFSKHNFIFQNIFVYSCGQGGFNYEALIHMCSIKQSCYAVTLLCCKLQSFLKFLLSS